MSRGDRDPQPLEPECSAGRAATRDRDDRPQAAARDWNPARDLTLPQTQDRQSVSLGRHRYDMRESETRLLAVVGAFRVVPESEAQRDLADKYKDPGTADRHAGDVRSLLRQGLLDARTVVINERPERVLVLTAAGKALLEAHRNPSDRPDHQTQEFHAGLVKPREVSHDAQQYRLYCTERDH